MRALNLDQLRTLETVVRLGSFTGAARELNLSQSAVSVQIRELEERLGVMLVERLGKKAYATIAGQEVIERATKIGEEAEAIVTAMRRFRDGWIGRVRMGTGLSALMYFLPPVIKSLRAEHPGIELLIRNLTTAESVEAILENKIDLGVVTLPIDEPLIRVEALSDERMVAILPADLKGVPEVVDPAYAAHQQLILEPGAIQHVVLRWLSQAVPTPKATMVIGTVEALKAVVAVGLGISIVPEMAISGMEKGLVVRPLDPPLQRTLAVIQHHNKPEEKALTIVREAILGLRTQLGGRKEQAALSSRKKR
jgi:DNA-binding transcriptional LysR family regulator